MWAAGLSALLVTANATWQEQAAQASLMCFWRFSKPNQLFCIFLPFFPPNIVPGVKTLLILFPTLGSYDSFIAVPY